MLVRGSHVDDGGHGDLVSMVRLTLRARERCGYGTVGSMTTTWQAQTREAQVSGPPLTGEPEAHLLSPLWHWAENEPTRPLLASSQHEGFAEHSAAEVRREVRDLAAGLIAHGVRPGDRVALLASNGVDWVCGDHGILAAGGVTVPIYDTSSVEQITWILSDSGAKLVLVETAAQAELVAELCKDLPAEPEVLAFEAGARQRLREDGRDRLDEVEARIAALTGDDLAALIYSSGTTGEPKGCELTHANLCANARQTVEQVPELFGPGARSLIFLPLAHALARMQLHASIEQGALSGFPTSIDRLPDELRAFEPTFIVAVPRIFEKVRQAAGQKAAERGLRRVFDRASAVAVRWADEQKKLRPSPWMRLQRRLFDPLVYAKVRDAFGGKMTLAICGGAALQADLGRFFDGVGITVLQGYGLTETSPIVSGGPVGRVEHGTVGHVYPATTVRVAGDGEILVRGPQVFGGYWHQPAATDATIREGWLHTGDLGAVTDTGELVVTGRKKDTIVTAGGKNVVPGPLEDRVRAHPLVDQCVVVGDGRPFVGAVLFLDGDELGKRRGAAGQPADEAALRAELDAAVAAANASVSRAEGIRAYRVVSEQLSIDSGAVTPTQKLRRRVVEDRFLDEIEALYR